MGKGILESSEITPFPLMLCHLSKLIVSLGPDGQPMDIELTGLGEISPSEYVSIMSDPYLTVEGKEKCLEFSRQCVARW